MEYRLEDAIGKPTGEDNGEVNGGVEKVPYLMCSVCDFWTLTRKSEILE